MIGTELVIFHCPESPATKVKSRGFIFGVSFLSSAGRFWLNASRVHTVAAIMPAPKNQRRLTLACVIFARMNYESIAESVSIFVGVKTQSWSE
jgi:hypothetical protein